jgi:hypothetical protein
MPPHFFRLIGPGRRRVLSGFLVVSLGAAPAGSGISAAGAAAPGHGTALHPYVKLQPRGTTLNSNLINHGGPVQAAPRIYLDFWGWTSDPSGEQPYLTGFLQGAGGTNWLHTVAQYGGGWTGNLLAGSWSHTATVPLHPTDAQIQAEAVTAAGHFGAGTSVDVQIVVATPTGHSTSGFGTQWCSYHGAVSADPSITYTNFPYQTDAGAACGASLGNPLAGVSIAESNEMTGSITDPLLDAWFDSAGREIGDKCGKIEDITTAKGTFPVVELWSNVLGGCA